MLAVLYNIDTIHVQLYHNCFCDDYICCYSIRASLISRHSFPCIQHIFLVKMLKKYTKACMLVYIELYYVNFTTYNLKVLCIHIFEATML